MSTTSNLPDTKTSEDSKDLDWSKIGEYFALFGLEETARELRKKYHGSY